MRKLSAAVLAGVLLISLSACGQSSGDSASSATASASTSASAAPAGKGTIDDVSVTVKDSGKSEPTVKLKQALADGDKATAKLVEDGDGAAIKEGQTLSVNVGFYDASTGAAMAGSSYSTAASIPMTSSSFTGLDAAFPLLQKAKVGASVVVAVPSSVTGSAAEVLVMHVADAKDPLVAWKKSTATSPSAVEVTPQGKGYAITIPQGDAPKKLTVDVLTKGTEGKAATSTSKVTAFYDGAQWENAVHFDGNFDSGKPTEFGLDQVIKGWTQGLTGLKAGSVVALTIPADLAYGDDASSGKPTGPLVFIVKITKVA